MAKCGNRIGAGFFALTVAVVLRTTAHAAIDHNQVGAFLVFPYVVAESTSETGRIVETFLTFFNAGEVSLMAHVVFINGNSCSECGFDLPVSPFATHTIVVTRSSGVTLLRDLATGAERTCSASIGFVTVNVETPSFSVLTDNLLAGHSLTVDYTSGASVDLEAIPVQGEISDGNRDFSFDGFEYRKFPSRIGADFIAPDFGSPPGIGADLVLFTLGFESRFMPLTDCSVTGIDAGGGLFSSSFQFGCWSRVSLEDISPEFAYPFLGELNDFHEHGSLSLQCQVFGTGSNPMIDGGVHGVLIQKVSAGAPLRRNDPGPAVTGAVSFGRVLTQSSTVGDAMTLSLDPPPFPID